jgi:hypothetical protein
MESNDLKHIMKLKRGFLAIAILIVLTLSFSQIGSYDSVMMSRSFTIADQEDLPTRGNMGMFYDNESDLVVIFGGWNNTDDPWNSTWTYDYNTDSYAVLSPSVAPPGRAEPGMTYDSVRDQIILFGGEDELFTPQQYNDTWTFDVDTNTWTEVFPTIAPSARRGHYLAFDSESDRVIMFGGIIGLNGPVINDTWAYNPGTNIWTEMSPATAPEARFSSRMVYDSESDRMILFGGLDEGTTYFDDTWAYDFNSDTWENIPTTTQPSQRCENSLTYDSESDKVVLFGGAKFTATYEDTWLFDYNTMNWTNMAPSLAPSKRLRHGSAYDWESDRVIIYSGTQNGNGGIIFVGDYVHDGKTWAYDVNTNTWEHIAPIHTTTTTTLPTTSPTTSPTTTPPPPPDYFWLYVGVGGVGAVLILAVIFVRRK